jgi:hypothetical protein
MAHVLHQCPTDISARFTRFHAKATIAQQAAMCRGTIGGFVQTSQNESAVPLAPQTRCGRLWGKSRPRKMLTRSGTCRGTRGIGLATFSYKLCVTSCLQTLRRLTIICLICPAARARPGPDGSRRAWPHRLHRAPVNGLGDPHPLHRPGRLPALPLPRQDRQNRRDGVSAASVSRPSQRHRTGSATAAKRRRSEPNKPLNTWINWRERRDSNPRPSA